LKSFRSRRLPLSGVLLITVLAVTLVMAGVAAAGGRKGDHKRHKDHKHHQLKVSKPWSFGVMSDTQWTTNDPAGANPNGVPVSIIEQIDRQFIEKGVKFVIQVGDLTESGNDADIATRAAAAEDLYDAGIGFFPMRGNHETYATPANDWGIPAIQADFPQTRGLMNTFGAKRFDSPVSISQDLAGISYSFDYGRKGDDARFVIVDPWATPSKSFDPYGTGSYVTGYTVADQQQWISSRLDEKTRGTEHAFVFSHQNLIGENHQDTVFSGYTNANVDMQNAFMASLQDNGVRYYLSGHDHVNQRSLIASPDGKSMVEELIGASDSSKFYTPKALTDAKWYGQKVRETSIAQELYAVGFYIYTIDGPRVTVDYYADDHGSWLSDGNYPLGPNVDGYPLNVTPTFHFVKKATWGYSQNGKEFVVGGAEGNGSITGTPSASYTVVKDGFDGTKASILSGSYSNSAKDAQGRTLVQTVDTGWTKDNARNTIDSDILTLWGMTPLGASQTDTYTLSMSVAQSGRHAKSGVLMARDANGRWVKAVDLNSGTSVKKYVCGPYKDGYGLGAYGYDPKTSSVWAVIDHDGSFAVDFGCR
jgi:hypothetical protein